ncbi:MAG: SDR family oxidoreductase [Chloroflexota bacterium]
MPKTLMCDPRLLQKDLSGQVYIVTGANSGSGYATAEQLAKQGATVVGACRRVNAGKEAVSGMGQLKGSVDIMELGLASLDSVRKFAAAFLDKYDRLDGLVNNAGIMGPELSKTVDGFETQIGINHLGHFLLTELLLDTLKASAPARIVCVSSVGHAGLRGGEPGHIDFDDLNYDNRPYSAMDAYAQSKLANVLHAVELANRLEGTNVYAFSVHPGWIRSNLVTGFVRFMQNVLLRPFSSVLGTMTWFEGAQTTLHCLLDEDAPNHNGAYYSQNSILYNDKENRPGGWPMSSPNPLAHDKELAKKLYDESLQWVGLEKTA